MESNTIDVNEEKKQNDNNSMDFNKNKDLICEETKDIIIIYEEKEEVENDEDDSENFDFDDIQNDIDNAIKHIDDECHFDESNSTNDHVDDETTVQIETFDALKICKIRIRCSNGEYICINDHDSKELVTSNTKTPQSAFWVIPSSVNKVYFQSVAFKTYLDDIDGNLGCHYKMTIAKPLQFEVVDGPNSSKYIKCGEIYLSSNSSITLRQINDDPTFCEQFYIEEIVDIYDPTQACYISLTSTDCKALEVDIALGDDSNFSTSNRSLLFCHLPPNNSNFKRGIFHSNPIENNKVTLKAIYADKFVSVTNDDVLGCTSYKSTDSSIFEVIKNKDDGTYLFKSCHGKYLSANCNQTIKTSFVDGGRMFRVPRCDVEHEQVSKYENWTVTFTKGLKGWTSAGIKHFGTISTVDQAFKVSFEIWIYRELSVAELREYLQNPQFEPHKKISIQPLNCEEYDLTELFFRIHYEEKFNCYIVDRMYILIADFTECLELDNFPFDVQHVACKMYYRVDGCSGSEMRSFQWLPEETSFWGDAEKPLGWRMHGMQVRSWYEWAHLNIFAVTYCVVLGREYMFYIWRVVIGLMMLSYLTICVFVAVDSMDQLAFVSSMFLTAVAFLFIVDQYLPKQLKWPTLIDKYILFVLFVIFAVGIQVTVLRWIDEENDDVVYRFFYINSILWIVVHIIFTIYSFIKYKKVELPKAKLSKEEYDRSKTSKNEVNERVAGWIAMKGEGNIPQNSTYHRYWSFANGPRSPIEVID